MTLRKSPAPAKVHPPLFLLYLGSPAQVRVECVKRDAAVVLGGNLLIFIVRKHNSCVPQNKKTSEVRRCVEDDVATFVEPDL